MSSEENKRLRIEPTTPAVRDNIKRKSAFSLPTRPSEEGIKPDEIKKRLYGFVTDDNNSVLAELDRIVEEANEALENTVDLAKDEATMAANDSIKDPVADAVQNAENAEYFATESERYAKDAKTTALSLSTLCAGALKGAANGTVVALDDVSTVEHRVSVGLRSKNLLFYPYKGVSESSSVTINGITYTDNGDGTILVNGTATGTSSLVLFYATEFNIPSGIQCHVSCGTRGTSIEQLRLRVACFDTNKTAYRTNDSSYTHTFTADERLAYISADIQCEKGMVIDNVLLKPMLNYGTEPLDYVPYVPPETQINVKSFGKNLINISQINPNKVTLNGGSLEVTADWGISGSGTPTGYISLGSYPADIPKGGILKISASGTFANIGCTVSIYDTLGNIVVSESVNDTHRNNHIDLSLYSDISRATFDVKRATDNVACSGVAYFQLEVGDTATDYEPYIEGEAITTTIAEGAELTSIAPNMTIQVDAPNVVMDCTYNRDLNKAFGEITQAIISLGGNV